MVSGTLPSPDTHGPIPPSTEEAGLPSATPTPSMGPVGLYRVEAPPAHLAWPGGCAVGCGQGAGDRLLSTSACWAAGAEA